MFLCLFAIPLNLPVSGIFHSVQPLKYTVSKFSLNSFPLIGYINPYAVFLVAQKYPKILSVTAISDRVGQQIKQDSLQCIFIALDIYRLLWYR